MKELSIEEKAKAYDYAIERARRMFSEKELNYIFPELAESDDEKIISAIRKAIEAKVENLGNGVTRTACLAWLEKQEDKDSQVKFPTFTFDDILALQCCMETVKKVQEDKDLYEKLNGLHGRVYDAYHLEKQGEQKPCMIQWKGDNLKEVVGFTGKDKNFEKWFKSFEEYEKYVQEHDGIFKLFNADGSHYEVPVGAWIVKTPDGYNVASKAIFRQKSADTQKFKVGDYVVDNCGYV